MAIIIDTGIFYGFYNIQDKKHQIARTIYSDILDGDYGQPILLDYVFDELVSLVQYRTKRNDLATEVGQAILSTNVLSFVQVTANAFKEAWKLFSHQNERKYLSFTDSMLVSMARELSIRRIASFESAMKRYQDINIISS